MDEAMDAPPSKVGRKCTKSIESYYNTTLNVIQKDKIVLTFTKKSVHCALCDSSVNVRTAFYLYYWEQHEDTDMHKVKLRNKIAADDLLKTIGKKPRNQSFLAAFFKPKPKPKRPADAAGLPNYVPTVRVAPKTCEGIMKRYDMLDEHLDLWALYCVEAKWYTLRDHQGRKNIFAIICPAGSPTMHLREMRRCANCQKVRESKRKVSAYKSDLKKRYDLLTRIDAIISRKYVTSLDVQAIKSFSSFPNGYLSTLGLVRKEMCRRFLKYYTKIEKLAVNKVELKTELYRGDRREVLGHDNFISKFTELYTGPLSIKFKSSLMFFCWKHLWYAEHSDF